MEDGYKINSLFHMVYGTKDNTFYWPMLWPNII
ncbi:MAG: hypothetical protein ACI965_002242, partial [Paraglaciecola sp.]